MTSDETKKLGAAFARSFYRRLPRDTTAEVVAAHTARCPCCEAAALAEAAVYIDTIVRVTVACWQDLITRPSA